MKKQPLTTDLVGDKTLKTDEKIEFFGQVDELSAFIMEFSQHVEDKKLEMELRKIVNEYNNKIGAFNGFILPGTTPIGAKAHIVRTVCRRAERAYARVYEKYSTSEIIFEYLNKLSSLFFAIARIYDEK